MLIYKKKYFPRRRAKKKRYPYPLSKWIPFILIPILIFVLLYLQNIHSDHKKRNLSADIIREGLLSQTPKVTPNAELLCKLMIQQLGKPYVYGGNGPDCFDCSGLTKFLYQQMGYSLPRIAADQSKTGVPIDKSDLKFGDIVFFSGDGISLTHVGIYAGNGYFLHAPKTGDVVKLSLLGSDYYAKTYKMAVRLMIY